MRARPVPVSMRPRQQRGSICARLAVLLLFLSLSACDLVLNRDPGRDTLIEIEIEAMRLSHQASLVRHGDLAALAELAGSWRKLEQSMTELEHKGGASARSWDYLNKQWTETQAQMQIALAAEPRLTRDAELNDQIVAVIPQLQSILMQQARQAVDDGRSDGQQLFALMQMTLLLERVNARLPRAMAGVEDAVSALDSISRDIGHFGKTLDSLRHGDAMPETAAKSAVVASPELDELVTRGTPLFSAVDDLMASSMQRFEAIDALDAIGHESAKLAEMSRSARLMQR